MTQAAEHPEHHSSLGIWPLLIMSAATLASPVFEGYPATALQRAEVGGWTRPVFYGLSYLMAGFVILPRLSSMLAVSRRMWTYLAMLTLILASASWSLFPEKVFMNFIHGVGLLLVAGAATLYGATRPGSYFSPVATLSVFVVVASVALVIVSPGLGIEPNDPWGAAVNRWRGITSNSNTLGSTAAIAACCSLVVFYTSPSRSRRMAALAAIPFCWFVLLYGCKSVTSTLGSLAFMGLFILLRSMEQNSPGARKLKLASLASLGILALSMAFLVNPDMDLGDLFFKATGRSKTLSGRTLLWNIAAKLIELKPYLGWSFDSIASARKALAGVMGYGQFHNGYLDITVRGGFTGLALLLLMLLRCLRSSLKLLATRYRIAAGALSLLAFTMVINMAETTFVFEGELAWSLFMTNWMSVEAMLYQQQQEAAALATPGWRPGGAGG